MNAALLLLALCLPQKDPMDWLPVQAGPEEIIERIRENLARIDESLFETVDAEDDVAPRLAEVRRTHLEVIRDLDELIQQARYRASQQGGGGGGGQGGGGSSDSPSGQPPPRPSDGSSGSESGPAPSPQESASESEGEQGRPEGSRSEEDAGRERDGAPPPPDDLGDFTRNDTDGRWGLLPPKLQERLMNLHVDDVPERYRDWLSAYIRSMHALEQREGP